MKIEGRATTEDIDSPYPHLLARLRDHPGVGFLLVASRIEGGMVLGRSGSLRLDAGEVTSIDPLAGYGPHAREQIARTHDFDNCADIIVNSAYDPETDEASAFEMHVATPWRPGRTAEPWVPALPQRVQPARGADRRRRAVAPGAAPVAS